MKAMLILLILTGLSASAQVGVNTTTPTATLDVNGNMRLRTTAATTRLSAPKDSLLVVDQNGNIVRVTSRNVIMSHLKSFVKGGLSSTANQTISLGSANVATAPFGFEEFDENDEYNNTTYTFTAANAGIYSVSAQIKASAALSLTSNFGIAVVKNGSVIARSGFGNISVLSITVSPPIRSVNTLVKLAPGDTLSFQIYADLLNAGVTGTREDSFFWIAQQQ
ncbi:hypothetical protein [Flavobacterium selenitireducens]|uniref:hypothetical protein n=1 Tax=Flavobacterium selenitireducens TaxID=2722704 RepID=UPI00168B8CA3|nr:hypothetical protein [Flavobacterium selenitireducens]MBD3582229.1 hypothetical protein [Flavobacterium selenitireducens]